MLRRLHHEQPESFAFTPENHAWAETQIAKFPEGRQASAIIPLLTRAQEQEGWLTRPAIEHVAAMLDLAYIRALEVATFYFMFQLQPVGSVAHVQVCGTTSCMICGAEDLIGVCREKIAAKPHALSADGKFSWEEVECLGACSNAPMAQIGKDYYEDLTAERFGELLDELAAGRVPEPGSQIGRYASEPSQGLTSLKVDHPDEDVNASVALARARADTVKRIDGTELPLSTPWLRYGARVDAPRPVRDDHLQPAGEPGPEPTPGPRPSAGMPADETGVTEQEAHEAEMGHPEVSAPAGAAAGESRAEAATGHHVDLQHSAARKPELLDAPRGQADDLSRITGVGPKLATMLNEAGVFHFEQIAAWTEAELEWIDENLPGFRGRAVRDDWVEQARELIRTRGS